MANLQVLRKRYKSIQTTADMAAAMKTAATVKYSKISKKLISIFEYSLACDEALALFGTVGFPRQTAEIRKRNCLVVFSSDRGFCGGFNGELLRFFEEKIYKEKKKPLLIVIGQKEAEEGLVAVRSRYGGDLGQTTAEEFLKKIIKEAEDKVLPEKPEKKENK